MRKFLLVLSVLLFAGSLFATDYYVAKTGNNSWDGLAPAWVSGTNGPWLTIAKATTVMVAGDICYVCTGTYAERIMLTTGNSGTDANRITYKNYPGESPVLDGTSFGYGSAFWSGMYASPSGVVHYITIDGFEIKNYPEMGIAFDRNQATQTGSVGSHGITIKNCISHDNGQGVLGAGCGIYLEGGDVGVGGEGYGHLITLNECYGNTQHGIKFTGDTFGTINRQQIRNSEISWNICHDQPNGESNGQGIHASTGAHDNLIAHNTCYSNGSAGISTDEAWNNIIEYNTSYSNGVTYAPDGSGIVLWNSSNTIIRYNFLYNNASSGIGISGALGGSPTKSFIHYNIVLHNNTSLGASYGGIVLNNSLAHDVYNNLLYNNHMQGIYVQLTANQNIKNNIIYSVGAGRAGDYLIRSAVTAGWTANKIDYNCYYTTDLTNPWYWGANRATFALWKSNSGMDTNGINVDPVLVNPGGTTSADYKIQTTSPCKDVGVNVSLAQDYFGGAVPYNTTPDIGAHEYTANGPTEHLFRLAPGTVVCIGAGTIVRIKN